MLKMKFILLFFIAYHFYIRELSAVESKLNLDSASYNFDVNFLLDTPGQGVDISKFSHIAYIPPGEYQSDIYLNNKFLARKAVEIRTVDNKSRVCFSESLYYLLNIDVKYINEERFFANLSECLSLESQVSGSSAYFELADMHLNITIPQEKLRRKARDVIDPKLFSVGENAFFVNYNNDFYQADSYLGQTQSIYSGMNFGYNFSGWMFRHAGSYSWRTESRGKYEASRSYIQHDIVPLNSRLTLGESYTRGEFFDSFLFRGVYLNSEDQLLSDTQSGYAPVIRGIARTNAQVTVRQGNMLLYEIVVPPGAFIIDDLYPTGYGGDLLVQIHEADGSVSSFSVPYNAMAQLLRPGGFKYTALGGVISTESLTDPSVLYGTLQYGMTNHITGYSGLLLSEKYYSGILGAAFATPVGALAMDVTLSQRAYAGAARKGALFRTTYNKVISENSSSISVVASLSSPNYTTVNSAFVTNREYDDDFTWSTLRQRVSVSLNQSLDDNLGQLTLSGIAQRYWQRPGFDMQYQIGYGNYIGTINYNLSAARTKDTWGRQETQYIVSFSFPLGKETHPSYFNSYTTLSDKGISSQSSVNGSWGSNNQATYSIAASRGDDNKRSFDFSSSYKTPFSTIQGSYSQGNGYSSRSLGANGSIVVLSDTILTTPYTPQTLAIIDAPDAAGAHVEGYDDIIVDKNGHAVIPYLTPYRMNMVSLDPQGISADVEMKSTSQNVAPYYGAVVKLNFDALSGRAILIRAVNQNGEVLPFGAHVFDQQDNMLAIVSQNGQIYIRLASDKNKLVVKWGEGKKRSCSFQVHIPKKSSVTSATVYLENVNATCM